MTEPSCGRCGCGDLGGIQQEGNLLGAFQDARFHLGAFGQLLELAVALRVKQHHIRHTVVVAVHDDQVELAVAPQIGLERIDVLYFIKDVPIIVIRKRLICSLKSSKIKLTPRRIRQ